MNATSDSTDSLFRAVRHGESDSLNALLSAYRNYLKLLARTQTDILTRKRLDPSDLVQDVLLEAYQHFGSFRGQSIPELVAWLRQILIRKLIDHAKHHRAEKRDVRREQSLSAAIENSSEFISQVVDTNVSSPSAQLSKQENCILLANVLERLPADYRDVIMLRQFDQMPFRNVATKLGRTPGATRMLFARAIDRLRLELQEAKQ